MLGYCTSRRPLASVSILLAALLLGACNHDGGAGQGNDGSSDNTPPAVDDRDPSIARQWSEVLLEAIRGDFARPTIHARNLFHVSSAMYDAWAAYSDTAETYLLGNEIAGFECTLDGLEMPADIHTAREEAISYAAYRLIRYRFRVSPSVLNTEDAADELLEALGYDPDLSSTDYTGGSAAALGNHIAECYIAFGLQDGSNEAGFFRNVSYEPVNFTFRPDQPGNPTLDDPNRWQPIFLPTFIDQSGNLISTGVEFLSPEWGLVVPFAMTDADKTTYTRDGSQTQDGQDFEYPVFYDPGPPPLAPGPLYDAYQWGFSLVSIWSAHLDQADGVMMDISPASLGSPDNVNASYYPDPQAFDTYDTFYDTLAGGDPSTGYAVNPVTGAPYEPQIVPRGDYARVLAEFWADGPDSETPPGHWFVILNEVNDHPLLEKRFGGAGRTLGPLEWDVKAYFTMGGAMHDAAIAAWSIKGWYDYLRPVSAIRAMADNGQSSDAGDLNYSPDGIPLEPGFIEIVRSGDPLAGAADENVGKIKLYAWRGPDYIANPFVDQAGVGWILAENWWPYQRPIVRHTTVRRLCIRPFDLLARRRRGPDGLLTGSEYFPGWYERLRDYGE